MSLDKGDGAVEKLMEEGNGKRVDDVAGDKYDELNKLEVNDRRGETAYAGMGKEELMKYANSPFWVRLRWFLFVTFWLSWFAMMVGAMFIIFISPKCLPSTKLEWFQRSPVYIVNAASLVNLDDLDEKVEYMQNLGVKNIVLSSVFKADKDEIIDFMQVNASLGNENIMKELITKLKAKNMKVMLKLVPNHSSTSNLFFERSVLKEAVFKDYYVWNPGFSDGVHHWPINNWLSVTGGSAWKWNDLRKEFYLHQFSELEADFNFRNKEVIHYFETVFKFWLDIGIDGLYLDQVQYLFEDKDFKNETSPNSHEATSNLRETKELLSQWGKLIGNKSGILIVSDLDTKNVTGVNLVHSSVMLTSNFTGEDLLQAILSKTTSSPWPSWEWVCNEKSNCWKNETKDAFNILGSLLPGIPFVYADPKLFEDNHIPNVTVLENTLKELRSLRAIEFSSFNAKLLNNDTVLAFDRVTKDTDSILFVWNLNKNDTLVDLSSFDGVPEETNLTLCTQSACSNLPPINSKVNTKRLNLAAESAVVLKF